MLVSSITNRKADACLRRQRVLLPTFARTLRVSRAASGLSEPQPPAWLSLSKGLIRGGTSAASWYRYEAGTHCPRAHVVIAMADAYARTAQVAPAAEEKRRARLQFIGRMCDALRADARALGTQSHSSSFPLPAVACDQVLPYVQHANAAAAKFPHFGAVLTARRAALGASVECMRRRFPDWTDDALRRLSKTQSDERLLASTIWRFEVGDSVPNGVVFALMPEAYRISLTTLVDAIDADIARWLFLENTLRVRRR